MDIRSYLDRFGDLSLRWWRWCWLPVSYALLCVPLFWQTFGVWSTSIATRCVDRCDSGWQNVWSLWWVAHQLKLGQSPFYTTQLFYPSGVDLFWQILMVVNGAIMAPITLFFGAIFAFNMLIYVTFVATGWTMALFAERVTGHRAGAWIAGVLYMFMPFHVWLAYTGFAERLGIQYFPLLLWGLWSWNARQSWRDIVLIAVATIASLLTSLYYGLFSLVYIALWSMIYLWYARRDWSRVTQFLMQFCVLAVGLVIVLLRPLMSQLIGAKNPFAVVGESYGLRDYLTRQLEYSANPLTLFFPSLIHPWWGDAFVRWFKQFDATHYPVSLGFMLVLLGILGWVWQRREIPMWLGVMTMVTFVLALGPRLVFFGYDTGIPLPYEILNYIPLVRLGQRPDHWLFVFAVHMALFAAYAMRAVTKNIYATYWLVVVLCVGAFELYPQPLVPVPSHAIASYAVISPSTHGAVLSLPFDLDDGDVMYGQLIHQRPSVSGYVPRLGNFPLIMNADGIRQLITPTQPVSVANPDAAAALQQIMTRLDIEYLVYDSRFGYPLYADGFDSLREVAHDPYGVVFQRKDPSALNSIVVIDKGWDATENNEQGQRWQWSGDIGSFWVYQPPQQQRATILTMRIRAPKQQQITLDGVRMTHPISFEVSRAPRLYHVFLSSHSVAEMFWIQTPTQLIKRRLVGVALDEIRTVQTLLPAVK